MYQESQLSLVVTLWLSGVVVDRTFTPGGVDVRARLFVDHRCVNVFIRVFNFRGWSQLRNYFNSEIFLIYSTVPCLAHVGLSSRTVRVVVEIVTLEVGSCRDVLSLAVGPMACGQSRSRYSFQAHTLRICHRPMYWVNRTQNTQSKHTLTHLKTSCQN